MYVPFYPPFTRIFVLSVAAFTVIIYCYICLFGTCLVIICCYICVFGTCFVCVDFSFFFLLIIVDMR